MDQYIGKLLDNRYELLERIGTGGMAVVYKARCHRLNRLVAVKILKPELAGDSEFRRRFHDESQAVAMLSHPNIVAVYDVSRSDALDYIVMELIDGITLKQYMQKRGTPLNWREALHFITQIVKALGHAHSRGIIHRDIKPHNIMVLRDGSVKVADFGIARLTSAAQSTLTQEALGSVHYISPEQARGSHIDGRSDLYSAGVVLYEMITGRLPFEGETPVSVAIQHINSIPISPRELNPELPEALEAITMRAMAPNVDHRYASADEMLVDLEEFRKNPNISFEYTPADLISDDSANEPTQIVSAAHIRAESDDSIRRRRANEAARRQREEAYEEYDEPRRRKGVSPAVIAVSTIILFIIGIFIFLWNSFLGGLFAPTESYTVPTLLGMTIEEIMADPNITAVFQIVEGPTMSSEEYELGQVAKQDPLPNSTVKEGNLTITVNISSGTTEDELRMPDVTNMESRQAVALLRDQMGFEVKQERENSDTINEDYVISSDPVAKEALTEGQVITIVISMGPLKDKVTVPNLQKMTLEEAQKTITDYRLQIGSVTDVSSDEIEKGRVVLQSIPASTEVDAGTEISIQVSTGPASKPSESPSPSTSPDGGGTTPGGDGTQSSDSGTQPINIDLSNHTGTVQVKVEVGGKVVHDTAVSASVGSYVIEATSSGTQTVRIYIDGTLEEEFPLTFS